MLNTQNFLDEYLGECKDILDRISVQLGKLEKGGYDREIIRSISRDTHTLKGSSQLFGFMQTGAVAHAMESCMEAIKDAPVETISNLVDTLYSGHDLIAKLISAITQTQAEAPMKEDLERVVAALENHSKQVKAAPAKAASAPAPKPTPTPTPSMESKTPAPSEPKASAPAAKATPTSADAGSPRRSGESPAEAPVRSASDDLQSDTIRVQVGLLDNLMNMVGELVLIKNQLEQTTKAYDNDDFFRISQRLNVVTAELQADVMKTRMQPIGNALTRFHRVVRDLSRDLEKSIELKLEGTETELDKTLIEAVKDPLTHIIRNAIDHGLEKPAERRAAGKPETGQILVRSFHESGQIVIEVSDDGRGLHRDKLAAKIVEKGLASADALARLSDREVHQYIFMPGFSTADKVSNLSGRGVGMDVVRTNIEKIGGTIDLTSAPGQGMTIRLKIPLTLAIIPALIVRGGSHRFAIPQVKLVELLRTDAEDAHGGKVELLQGRPVYRLRGQLLPLVSLCDMLKLPSATNKDGITSGELNIAVLNADQQLFGMVVDAIEDSADIVVKPMAAFLKDLGVYSGATILGDGSIALTLDVNGAAEKCGISKDRNDGVTATINGGTASASVTDERIEYLLVDIEAPGKFALPLCLVNRLEEFDDKDIRWSGDNRVVKYRDALLPLISVREQLKLPGTGLETPGTGKRHSVVVVRKGDRNYGLEVRSIVDVLVSERQLDTAIRDRPGLIGTLIDHEDVVVMIDALEMINMAMKRDDAPGAGGPAEPSSGENVSYSGRGQHILVVDDTSFFRNIVTTLLKEQGYRVTTAIDGERALELIKASDPNTFAAVVSDIEMPNLTGVELAAKLRQIEAHRKLPMIAMTASWTKENAKKGFEAGFNEYLPKFDPEVLTKTLANLISKHAQGGQRHVA